MKIKLLILFFISAFSSYAQIVNIPDANFKACLVANASLNTNGDLEIQISEATAYTGTIVCAGNSVVDLAGIEVFTEIVGLQMFSNNLTSANVSQNTKLEQLLLEGNNLQGDLDLSALTSLIDFKADTNSLANINVANGNNVNFTRFQAQGNSTLDCIQIDSGFTPNGVWLKDSSASYNENCPAFACAVIIPDANFKAALVNNSTINTNGNTEIECTEASAYTGSITISNSSIADLTGIEAFTEITILQAFGNQITALDISQNTKLEQLLLEQNNLQGDLDLSALTSLVDFKAHTNSITNINIANGNNANITRFQAQSNSALNCIQIDSGFTPNGVWLKDSSASYNTQCSAFLSVDEFFTESIALYPNPTATVLNIKMLKKIKEVKVYSVLGEVVLSTNSKTIDVSNLKAGLYILNIKTENGNKIIKRFIKQ